MNVANEPAAIQTLTSAPADQWGTLLESLGTGMTVRPIGNKTSEMRTDSSSPFMTVTSLLAMMEPSASEDALPNRLPETNLPARNAAPNIGASGSSRRARRKLSAESTGSANAPWEADKRDLDDLLKAFGHDSSSRSTRSSAKVNTKKNCKSKSKKQMTQNTLDPSLNQQSPPLQGDAAQDIEQTALPISSEKRTASEHAATSVETVGEHAMQEAAVAAIPLDEHSCLENCKPKIDNGEPGKQSSALEVGYSVPDSFGALRQTTPPKNGNCCTELVHELGNRESPRMAPSQFHPITCVGIVATGEEMNTSKRRVLKPTLAPWANLAKVPPTWAEQRASSCVESATFAAPREASPGSMQFTSQAIGTSTTRSKSVGAVPETSRSGSGVESPSGVFYSRPSVGTWLNSPVSPKLSTPFAIYSDCNSNSADAREHQNSANRSPGVSSDDMIRGDGSPSCWAHHPSVGSWLRGPLHGHDGNVNHEQASASSNEPAYFLPTPESTPPQSPRARRSDCSRTGEDANCDRNWVWVPVPAHLLERVYQFLASEFERANAAPVEPPLQPIMSPSCVTGFPFHPLLHQPSNCLEMCDGYRALSALRDKSALLV